MLNWISSRFLGFRKKHAPEHTIIKVKVSERYNFYYPFPVKEGSSVKEMNAEEFQHYLSQK